MPCTTSVVRSCLARDCRFTCMEAMVTIKVHFTPEEKIFVGHMGETELKEIQVPLEDQAGWRVEAEFIGAIRGEENRTSHRLCIRREIYGIYRSSCLKL